MKIKKWGKYQIKGKSEYFKKKYGTSNPIITIEDTDEKIFGSSWKRQNGNPACMLFGMRSGFEGLSGEKVWGGKIENLSELVFEHELEKIKDE